MTSTASGHADPERGRARRLTEAKLSAAATRRTACRGYSGAWAGAGSGDDDGSFGMRLSYRRAKRLVPPDDELPRELPDRSLQAREQLRMRDARRDWHGARRATAQEEQIAGLARDGLSNPEIGAPAVCQPAQVEWHLKKVFTKLGI